jgi:tetratricopeptide (TPR) repeat protein
MKSLPTLICLLLGLTMVAPEADARGENKRSGASRSSGASRNAPSRSSSSSAKRSPMTGSKVQRPAAKPANRAVTKPASQVVRPSAKPAAHPETRPAPRPETKPATRPAFERPTTRPDNKLPDKRPGTGGMTRPDNKLPDKRPGTGGMTRPDNKLPNNRPGNGDRPNINRPDKDKRPQTLPGMVTYPNKPGKDRPDRNNNFNTGDRNNIKIDNSRNRGDVNIKNVNVNRRNTNLNRPDNVIGRNNRDWDNNRWGGNRGVWGNNNNINVNIDNNFRRTNNFSYRPNYWGARPWWGAGNYHSWHHGHWGYGYNSNYYRRHWYYQDDNFASGFMWGIAVWSLGNMVYDMGYQSYRNPYPAPPVQNTYITYAQPVSVAAAANPPGDEVATTLAETKSADATQKSRMAFKTGDYLTALKNADEAIAYTPGDVTLHEYRALLLFALGRYSDAAGVLNPVLASGPGWGWDTMVGFYDPSSTYDAHLRKLEGYVKGRPDAADSRFLLGYHYLVCGHMEKAYEQFDKAATLQPADSISRQLRDLTKNSLPDAGGDDAEPEQTEPPAPIPSEKLVGTWISDRGQDGKVTFKMEENGDYTWNYMNGTESSELKGTYGLNDKGLLVLTSDDSQMISVVTLADDKSMKFTLVGAPDGDPGLDFAKN